MSSDHPKSICWSIKYVMYAITFYKGNNTVFVTYSFSSGTYLLEPFGVAGLVKSVPEFKRVSEMAYVTLIGSIIMPQCMHSPVNGQEEKRKVEQLNLLKLMTTIAMFCTYHIICKPAQSWGQQKCFHFNHRSNLKNTGVNIQSIIQFNQLFQKGLFRCKNLFKKPCILWHYNFFKRHWSEVL